MSQRYRSAGPGHLAGSGVGRVNTVIPAVVKVDRIKITGITGFIHVKTGQDETKTVCIGKEIAPVGAQAAFAARRVQQSR
jgi:hypothetical protein